MSLKNECMAALLLMGVAVACSNGEADGSTSPSTDSGATDSGEKIEKTASKDTIEGTVALLVDATEQSGLDFRHVHGGVGNRESPETMGGGVGLLDYDRDGDLDAYLVQSGPLRLPGDVESRNGGENVLFSNRGEGRFDRVEGAAGAADAGYGMGCAVGDWNGDGWDDVLVLNWGANTLLANYEGVFTDLTESSGLGRLDSWSVSAAFFDSEGDGDLDLYIVNYVICAPSAHLDEHLNSRAPQGFRLYPTPDVFPAARDRFLINDGKGALTDAPSTSGMHMPPGKGLGIVVTDIDLDGLPDLYIVNDGTPNLLFHNQGQNAYSERGQEFGVAFNDDGTSEAGMGVDAGDVDGDGDFDLFVTNLDDETNSLYLNRGADRPGFRDRTRHTGLAEPSRASLGFGALFEDFDLDGDLDLFLCNGHIFDNVEVVHSDRTHAQPNQLFLGENGMFVSAPPGMSGSGVFNPSVSRGSAVGDLNGDGALDILIGNNNSMAQVLFSNPTASEWARIELRGPDGNPHGTGANVWLESGDGSRRLRRIASARSYASASEPVLVSGTPGGLKAVEVQWPGGFVERFGSVAVDDGIWICAFEKGK